MGKQALPGKRTNLFMMEPEDLVVVGVDLISDDVERHPLYDARALMPLEESMVLNIMAYGVLQPITVARDGEQVLVVDGRRRVLHAREAKKRQASAGEVTVSVPCVVKRGNDGRLFGISRSTNAHRVNDDVLGNAANAQRMLDLGESMESVAIAFGVGIQTIGNWLDLLGLDRTVQTAVARGEIGATSAVRLAKLPKAEQKTILAELKAQGKVTTKKTAAVVRAKKTGEEKKMAPSKRMLMRIVEHADNYSGSHAAGLDEAFVNGIKFAIGELPANRIKGLTDAMREVSGEE